jgi:Tol biopolymer transport system component
MDRISGAGRRARWRFAWLCLSLLVALGLISCSPHITQPPLPELHIPGVSKVPGFDSFFKTVDVYPHDELGTFTAYLPGGASQAGRALLPLAGNLYSIGLDGRPPFTIHTPTHTLINTCFDRPTIAPNGRWLLCSTTAGIIAIDLQTLSDDNVKIALTNQRSIELPAFAPDGKRFVVNLYVDENCELAVYTSEPPYDNSRLVTGLLFPDLIAPAQTAASGFARDCVMTDVSWSPDGNWIAFIAGRGGEVWKSHLYALDLRTIALPSDVATDPARTITIPAGVVHDYGAITYVGDVGTNLTWSQASDTVSMPAGNKIINVNLRTNERQVILSVEDAEICAASWTPDDTQLFFALCRPYHGNPDISAPPPELYVYTP